MTVTRKTLLERVKDSADQRAWNEFYGLYAPLIYRYARGRGLSQHDAEEIRDQCFEVIGRRMAGFTYDRRKGHFKSWLYRIVSGKIIDHFRRRPPASPADTSLLREIPSIEPPADEIWETRWRERHLVYCLERARDRVSEQNYRAFRLLLLDGHSVKEVCTKLSLSANQVYKAKARVLARVREILSTVE